MVGEKKRVESYLHVHVHVISDCGALRANALLDDVGKLHVTLNSNMRC